jgi:hypothetical protein
MPGTMDEFIGQIERDLDRWRADLIKFQAMSEKNIAEQISLWITEAEKIIAEYRRHA